MLIKVYLKIILFFFDFYFMFKMLFIDIIAFIYLVINLNFVSLNMKI